MDIALNRQEQIITYQGKAYNMIGRGLLIATATAFSTEKIITPPILMIQDSIVLAKNMLKTEATISPISANVSIPLN